MSNWDKDRYQSLISRCAVDFSFYKGTYQDLGPKRLAMTLVGTGRWAQVNGLPARSDDVGSYPTSAAVASIVDVTAPFSMETTFYAAGTNFTFLSQRGGTGGFQFYDLANVSYLVTYNNAGGIGRYLNLGVIAPNRVRHYAMTLDPVALSGAFWINGVPSAVTFVSTSAPANIGANTAVLTCYPGAGCTVFAQSTCRCYPFALTNADVACLYGAAKSLVGEI